MAGILRVDQIKNTSGSGNIEIPAGYKLVSNDIGAFSAPGSVINFGSCNTGTGSGARLSTTSTSFTVLNINGTNQAVFGSLTKYPSNGNVLVFNKKSSNSQLAISINFPTYNSPGGSGHGVRVQHSLDYTTWNTLDIVPNGPAHGWGFHGYGGNHSAMNNFTWNTYDNSTYRSAIQNHTGDFYFYFQVANWSSADTIYYNDYNDTYPKYGTIQVLEIAQ